jgi:hypothetical protein
MDVKAIVFYRLVVVDAGSGEILGLTESTYPFDIEYAGMVVHSSMFPPVALRSDRAGFYEVKGVNSTSARILTVVKVERLYDEEPADRLPRFKHLGWELDVALGPERLPGGMGKSGRPYWMVRLGDGRLIGGFISDDDETMDMVAEKAAHILEVGLTDQASAKQ